MSTRPKKTTKTPLAKKESKVSQTRKPASSHPISSPVDQILSLQKTIGNQAVQKLFQTGAIQAKLKIGRPSDEFVQKLDKMHNSPPASGPGSRSEPLVSGKRAVQKLASMRRDAYYRSPVNPKNPVLVWTDGRRLFFAPSEEQNKSGRIAPSPEPSFVPPGGYISEEIHWDRGYVGFGRTTGGPLVIIARQAGKLDIQVSITNTLEQMMSISKAHLHTTREGSEFLSSNDTKVPLELSGASKEGDIHRVNFTDGFFRYRAAGGDHDLYLDQRYNPSAYVAERSTGSIIRTFLSGTISSIIPDKGGVIQLEQLAVASSSSEPTKISIDLRKCPPIITTSSGHISIEAGYASTKARLQSLGVFFKERGLTLRLNELKAIESALLGDKKRRLKALVEFKALEGLGLGDPLLEVYKGIGHEYGGGLAAKGSGVPALYIYEPFETSTVQRAAVVRHEMTHIIMGAIDAVTRSSLTPEERADLEGAVRYEARKAKEKAGAGLLSAGEYGLGVPQPSVESLKSWRRVVGEDPELAVIWVELLKRYSFIPDPEGTGELRGVSLADESRYSRTSENTGHPADSAGEFVASFVTSATVFRTQFVDTILSAETAGNVRGGRGGSYIRKLYRRAWKQIDAKYVPLGTNPF